MTQMDQEPMIASNLGAVNTNQNSLLDGKSELCIRIGTREDVLEDHLILAVVSPGDADCRDLLSSSSTLQLLDRVGQAGVENGESALLAVADGDVIRSVYVTTMPQHDFRCSALWIAKTTDVLRNLKTRKIGFYFGAHLNPINSSLDIVTQVVRSLLEFQSVESLCLVVGRHDYNEVLRLGLALKEEFSGQTLSVRVLH